VSSEDATTIRHGLSIVVPSYERMEQLTSCLEALASLLTSEIFLEVIVVDDGSSVPPEHAVAAVADRLDIRLHSQENSGPATARNVGAGLAKYRWLAFTDDDCAPEPDWAQAMVKALRSHPDALVGGSTVNALRSNVYSEASQHLVNALYRWQGEHESQAFWTSNNLACSREAFLGIGGFDESFPLPAAEDRELGVRWQRSGASLISAPDAVVRHYHSLELPTFWRQHHNYGRGAFRYRQVLADDGDSVPTQPPSFYLTLLAEPFRNTTALRAVPLAGLIALSQVATVAGYLTERFR